MIRLSEEEFQNLSDSVIESLPEYFKSKVSNLVFLVEQYPSENDLNRLGMSDKTQLLGLYSGVPYSHRSTAYYGTMPDRIILFQKNIESLCYSLEDLKNKIREVVIHEIAHYFGMKEDEIRNAGY